MKLLPVMEDANFLQLSLQEASSSFQALQSAILRHHTLRLPDK